MILRPRQLYLRRESARAVLAEGLLRAVDHVRYQPPALAVGLHAREPQRADAVEPEAARDARRVLPRRLELCEYVVAAYDARAGLRAGARVCLLLEGLRGGVDEVRARGRDGRDEQRVREVLRPQGRERAHGRALHRGIALLPALI